MLHGVSTWKAAGFLGMSEKTLRVVYDHRIRFPVHTTSLILGVAKIPQSSNNYADQSSDTSGESHRQRAPECHSDRGAQNVCAACPCPDRTQNREKARRRSEYHRDKRIRRR